MKKVLDWIKENVDWIGLGLTAIIVAALVALWPSVSLLSGLVGIAAWAAVQYGVARVGQKPTARWRTEASCLVGATIAFLVVKALS